MNEKMSSSAQLRARVWAQVLAIASLEDRPPLPRHLVAACVPALRATGVAVTSFGVMPLPSLRVPAVLASDQRIAGLTDSQFNLDEGPQVSVARQGGGPVLVADLSSVAATAAWPVFAPAAVRLGMRAMFALPVRSGGIIAGTLEVYSSRPRLPGNDELDEALAFADVALVLLLNVPCQDRSGLASLVDLSDAYGQMPVQQATGMVSAQLEISLGDALSRLSAYALARDRKLLEIASDVTARRLRLPAGGAQPPDD